jgi:hypothetical protein
LATDSEARVRFPALPDFLKKKQVVGLERGLLSLVSTTEELLDKKSSGSCLENREHGRRDPSRWPRGILYPQKFATTSPRSGGRSVGIVRSRSQTMEFVCLSRGVRKECFCLIWKDYPSQNVYLSFTFITSHKAQRKEKLFGSGLRLEAGRERGRVMNLCRFELCGVFTNVK